jgi:hypothetical protein
MIVERRRQRAIDREVSALTRKVAEAEKAGDRSSVATLTARVAALRQERFGLKGQP